MCACMHVYVCMYTCMNACICLHVYMHECMHVYKPMRMQAPHTLLSLAPTLGTLRMLLYQSGQCPKSMAAGIASIEDEICMLPVQ